MKFVDIYRYDGGNLVPVAFGCIQTGTAEMQRTPITKRFVMADGTPCTYPAANDTAALTVHLECTAEQARQLAAAVRFGVLVMAGLLLPAAERQDPVCGLLQQTQGIPVHITGAVQIREVSSGIFTADIPLQLELTDGEPSRKGVPCVTLPLGYGDCLFLDGAAEALDAQHYRCLRGGIPERRNAYLTNADTVTIRAYLASTSGTPAMQVLRGETVLGSAAGADCTVSASLVMRENLLTVRLYHASAPALFKPQILRIPVYRQG